MPTFQQRLDGFVNVLTKLGGSKDKRLAARFLPSPTLQSNELENLYNDSDLAYTVVSIFPESALRQGWETTIGDDTDGTREADLNAKLDELGAAEKVFEAACWGRLFGGGAVFLGIKQGNPDSPLSDEKGGDLLFLTVFDATELQPHTWYNDPFAEKFGKPETYRVTPSGTRDGIRVDNLVVHESRLVMFPGAHTTRRKKQELNGWDLSVLQRVYDVIRDFESGFAGASYLLGDANQPVFKVVDLLGILASKGGQEALAKRFEAIELSRSVANAMLIDKEEEFERKPTSFTGIPDVLDRLCNRLSAATGIPVSVLMGQAPAGLNATGASDVRMFYDRVKAYQDKVIGPAIETITKWVLISQGAEPESWSIKFNSLYQPTDLETAQLRKVVADTDAVYIGQGVTTPEEVTMSRFTPDGWSMETQVNLELREQIDAVNAEKALEQAKNPDTVAGQPSTLVPEKEPPPDAPKEDAFDPDQPRDESGRWGEGGAPSSKEKWDKARAHLAAKKQAQKVTQAKPVQADLNSTGRLPENAVVELGASTQPVKAGYEDLSYISDVYDTAVSRGFKGTLDEFKNKLPPGATQRANIVAGLDSAKLAKSETHAKVGHTTVERHFVKRVLDSVDQDSDDRAEDSGTDIEPAQETDSGTDRS